MSEENAHAAADSGKPCPCPACGAEVAGAKFCPECGAEVRQTPAACAACGHTPEAETNFCPECGAQMS